MMGKKILGYVQQEGNRQEMVNATDSLFQVNDTISVVANLQEFVTMEDEGVLLLHSLDDLNLQLIQLFPILEQVKARGQVVRFLNQCLSERLADEMYFEMLIELASSEKRTMQRRYEKSKIQAKAKGKTFGRPVIDESAIKKIQYLYLVQKFSIREISQKCGVSVGTVHKYIKQVR